MDEEMDYVKEYYGASVAGEEPVAHERYERYSSRDHAQGSGKKRGCFPKNATNKLKHWLFQNLTVR